MKKKSSGGSIIAKMMELELSLHLSTYSLFCDDVDIYIPEMKLKGRCQ